MWLTTKCKSSSRRWKALLPPRAAKWRRWKRWAARRLAYRVEKQREGFYVLFYVQGTGDTVKEFERRLKVTDTVIKNLTICTDEILQRAAKFKTMRTKQEGQAPPEQACSRARCALRSRGERASIKESITMPVSREGAPSGERPPRREGGGGRKQYFRRRKVCKFCTEKIDIIDYKDVRLVSEFVAERGKILPRRLTGTCSTHQRALSEAIKRARNIALLPFAAGA